MGRRAGGGRSTADHNAEHSAACHSTAGTAQHSTAHHCAACTAQRRRTQQVDVVQHQRVGPPQRRLRKLQQRAPASRMMEHTHAQRQTQVEKRPHRLPARPASPPSKPSQAPSTRPEAGARQRRARRAPRQQVAVAKGAEGVDHDNLQVPAASRRRRGTVGHWAATAPLSNATPTRPPTRQARSTCAPDEGEVLQAVIQQDQPCVGVVPEILPRLAAAGGRLADHHRQPLEQVPHHQRLIHRAAAALQGCRGQGVGRWSRRRAAVEAAAGPAGPPSEAAAAAA